jgi:hypothetical protein
MHQMEAQRPALGAGGTIVVDVHSNEPKNRRQLVVDTRHDTLLQEHDAVSLIVRPMTNNGYLAYILHLYVCSEINDKLGFENPAYLGKPGNPSMAILPTFEIRDDTPRQIDFDFYGTEYILGEPRKHGVPRPIPTTNPPRLESPNDEPGLRRGNHSNYPV